MANLLRYGLNDIVHVIEPFRLSDQWNWAVKKRINELSLVDRASSRLFCARKTADSTVVLFIAEESY